MKNCFSKIIYRAKLILFFALFSAALAAKADVNGLFAPVESFATSRVTNLNAVETELLHEIWIEEIADGKRLYEFTHYGIVNVVEQADAGDRTVHYTYAWSLQQQGEEVVVALSNTSDATQVVYYVVHHRASGLEFVQKGTEKSFMLRSKFLQ